MTDRNHAENVNKEEVLTWMKDTINNLCNAADEVTTKLKDLTHAMHPVSPEIASSVILIAELTNSLVQPQNIQRKQTVIQTMDKIYEAIETIGFRCEDRRAIVDNIIELNKSRHAATNTNTKG